MKTGKTFLLLVSMITLANLACSENDVFPLQKLEVNLVVLNEDGEKSSTLNAGADFFIGFELINHAADTFFLSHNDSRLLYLRLYQRDDFLLVYKLDQEGGDRKLTPIGKPYDPSIELNVTTNNIPGYALILPTNGRQYAFCIPWSSYADNQPLSGGIYYSSFEDTVTVDGIEIVIDTSIDFTAN